VLNHDLHSSLSSFETPLKITLDITTVKNAAWAGEVIFFLWGGERLLMDCLQEAESFENAF